MALTVDAFKRSASSVPSASASASVEIVTLDSSPRQHPWFGRIGAFNDRSFSRKVCVNAERRAAARAHRPQRRALAGDAQLALVDR